MNQLIDWHRYSNRLKSKTQIQSIKTEQNKNNKILSLCFFIVLNIQARLSFEKNKIKRMKSRETKEDIQRRIRRWKEA